MLRRALLAASASHRARAGSSPPPRTPATSSPGSWPATPPMTRWRPPAGCSAGACWSASTTSARTPSTRTRRPRSPRSTCAAAAGWPGPAWPAAAGPRSRSSPPRSASACPSTARRPRARTSPGSARRPAHAGTTVTLDMEDHTRVDQTLRILAELRADFPDLGCVIQSYLRRSADDCRDLATAGSRVRLCKGAYRAAGRAWPSAKADVDRSYARCLRILLGGAGYPMLATHDPRLIRIAGVAGRRGAAGAGQLRVPDAVRHPARRAAPAGGHGAQVRVYLPVRQRLVRLPGPAAGGAPGQPGVLPARPWRRAAEPGPAPAADRLGWA